MDGHKDRSADRKDNGQKAPLPFATKVEAMAAVTSALAPFTTQQIADFLQNVGNGNPHANRSLDKSGVLPGTVEWKGASLTKEDVEQLFAETELTEEQQEKAMTIFEAAVNVRLVAEDARREDAFEQRLTEAVEEIRADLGKDNDQYLSYVAERWLEKNETNAQSTLKIHMAEDFIFKLRELMEGYSIVLPEQVDVVDDLTKRLAESDSKLAAAVEKINEQEDALLDYALDEKFNEVTDGLALTQVEKLRELAENIQASTAEEFGTKLTVLKEALVESKTHTTKKSDALNEEFLGEEDEKTVTATPQVRGYAATISRHVKS
jgi:hypothetical protein